MSQPPSTGLDLTDIQGDIILGFPKRVENFIFFQIINVANFKKNLKQLIPAITTTAQVQQARKEIDDHKAKGGTDLLKILGINIAFSAKGLTKLGITDPLGDADFQAGQFANAQILGDPGTVAADGTFDPAWLPAFKGEIDGVALIAAESLLTVAEGVAKVLLTLGATIKPVFEVQGNVRPGKEKGHEHFGYLDGISSPAIASVTPPLPGQMVVQPGVLLLSQTGDTITRPAWAKNGSFLAYRQLSQLVPEFSKFIAANPVVEKGVPPALGSDLRGARLFGRWKSGAPVDITPTKDDPVLAADKQRNNNFDFSKVQDQTNCPFAAHIRKTNPRSDLGATVVAPHGVNRTGIPFGPEVTPDEAATNTTKIDRGLAFVCYQSNLAAGFQFLQHTWANNTNFLARQVPPVTGPTVTPGIDPIIGQTVEPAARARSLVGTDPNAQTAEFTLPIDFVVSKGGEYFFSPSLTALKSTFAA